MGACSIIPSPSPLSARSPKWQIRANPCSSEFPDCYRRGWRGSRLSDGCARVRPTTRIRVVDGGADLVAPPEITWQIAIGSLGTPLLSLPFQLSFGCSSFLTPQFSNSSAGVMPFVVAAIEFSKRIVSSYLPFKISPSYLISEFCFSGILINNCCFSIVFLFNFFIFFIFFFID